MSEASTIVIAGGTGFIGRRLCAVLAGEGHEIVVLTRRPASAPVGPVRFVTWDPMDAQGEWCRLLEGASACVNLCGESIGTGRWSESRKQTLIESRAEPTRALVHAINACQSPPAAFLQASGVGYYGIGERTCTEQTGLGEDFLADLACQWEAPLTTLRSDVRQIIARFGVVLGRNGGALDQMLMPFRLFVGGPLASGRQWLSWIHLHDAAAACAHLIASPAANGVFNVTAPEPIRNEAFAKAAGAALHRPTWMFTPRFVLKALLGEQATLVCDGQRATSDRLRRSEFNFSYPTIDTALTDLTN